MVCLWNLGNGFILICVECTEVAATGRVLRSKGLTSLHGLTRYEKSGRLLT